MDDKTPVSIKIRKSEWKKLREIAEEIGTTAPALVREMIHNRVKEKK